MNTYDHIQSKAYSGDNDYDAFRGRLVVEYTVERVDRRRNCIIRTTYEVIDIGRAEPIRAVDPGRNMGYEDLPSPKFNAGLKKSLETNKARGEERHARNRALLVAYLTEHGPQPLAVLLGLTDWDNECTMRGHLRANRDTYVQFNFSPPIWGLVGQSYTPPPDPVVEAMKDALRAHGPMTARELRLACGLNEGIVGAELRAYKDIIFRQTGEKRRLATGAPPAAIWTLQESI